MCESVGTGEVKERKLPLVFSSLGRPDGKSFFIRLAAALHICRPRCLMNTEAAVLSPH